MKLPKEDVIETCDGLDLYCEFYKAKSAIGTIVIIHGYGEHCGLYQDFAQFFKANKFHVMMFDLRGHGKSPGDRGDLNSVVSCVDDLDIVVARCKDRYPDLPISVFGHNIGASIAALYSLNSESQMPALVLSRLPFNLSVTPLQEVAKAFLYSIRSYGID